MKTKNPLYVVKGKEIEEAHSVLDLVIKKFNLGPTLRILDNIFKLLLDQVKTWPMFQIVKSIMDEMIQKILLLGKTIGLA